MNKQHTVAVVLAITTIFQIIPMVWLCFEITGTFTLFCLASVFSCMKGIFYQVPNRALLGGG